MDKFDQIIDDYKKKKLGVDEAVEKLCALDRENMSSVEYTDGEAKEARKRKENRSIRSSGQIKSIG